LVGVAVVVSGGVGTGTGARVVRVTVWIVVVVAIGVAVEVVVGVVVVVGVWLEVEVEVEAMTKRNAMKNHISVKLPITPEHRLGGLHREIASAELVDGKTVIVSAGFGLGTADLYVSIGGKRVLAVDGRSLITALIDAAIERTRKRTGGTDKAEIKGLED
jgi:hypothetical protein